VYGIPRLHRPVNRISGSRYINHRRHDAAPRSTCCERYAGAARLLCQDRDTVVGETPAFSRPAPESPWHLRL